MSKVLVSYFSVGGATEKIATELCQCVNGTLFAIKPAVPYSAEDLDYTKKDSRCSVEMTDPTSRPELASCDVNAEEFDTIYVGFPIWWGVAPHVVNTYLEQFNLAGKKVVIFATSAASGIEKCEEAIAPSVPGATVVTGCIAKTSEDVAALAKLA